MQERTAGIDLASEEHRLVVVDGDGHELEQRRIRHSESGLQALIARLRQLEVARVAIERPNGVGRRPAARGRHRDRVGASEPARRRP